MRGRMRVALIGHGAWGARLASAFDELGVLAVVCDVAAPAREAARARFLGVTTTSELDAALADDVDAIALATPSETHAELVVAGLAAGKHVFCEKPLASSLADALRVREAARRSRRVVQVGHLLEFSPAVAALRERVRGGGVGAVERYASERLQTADRGGVDPLWDLLAHDAGLLLGTLDAPVTLVSARAPRASAIELSIELADGARASLVASYGAPERRRVTRVIGACAELVLDELAGTLVELPRVGAARTMAFAPDSALHRELGAFAEAVRTGGPSPVDVDHAVEVVRILHAAERSRALGGAPVSVGQGARAVAPEPARGFA